MRRLLRPTVLALLTVAIVAGLVSPASAERPPWAGPPHVDTEPIVGSDPPTFLCNDQLVQFTDGEVTFRFRQLPRDGETGTIRLHNAEASNGAVVYRAHGGGQFHFIGGEEDGHGHFHLRITFVGPSGDVERVNTTFRIRNGEESIVERGTCSVVFDDP